MNKISKKILLIITIVYFGLVALNFSNAQIVSGDMRDKIKNQDQAFVGEAGFATVDEGSIGETVAVIIKAFLSFLGIIFVILIIYGGYLWMTARGNEEQVNKAKDTLQKAIIGLIIILAAYSITYTIFNELPFNGGTGGSGGLVGS